MHSIQTVIYLGLLGPPQMHGLVAVQDKCSGEHQSNGEMESGWP
jgi:hypothetical protein